MDYGKEFIMLHCFAKWLDIYHRPLENGVCNILGIAKSFHVLENGLWYVLGIVHSFLVLDNSLSYVLGIGQYLLVLQNGLVIDVSFLFSG